MLVKGALGTSLIAVSTKLTSFLFTVGKDVTRKKYDNFYIHRSQCERIQRIIWREEKNRAIHVNADENVLLIDPSIICWFSLVWHFSPFSTWQGELNLNSQQINVLVNYFVRQILNSIFSPQLQSTQINCEWIIRMLFVSDCSVKCKCLSKCQMLFGSKQ